MVRGLILFCLLALSAEAARLQPERHYQEQFCTALGGVSGVYLPDGTQVDCLTTRYAIEVEFADKLYEAVGQSQHYARMTGAAPGILVVLESARDQRFLDRMLPTIDGICPHIQVWTLRPGEEAELR